MKPEDDMELAELGRLKDYARNSMAKEMAPPATGAEAEEPMEEESEAAEGEAEISPELLQTIIQALTQGR